jgi:hypothetical protein
MSSSAGSVGLTEACSASYSASCHGSQQELEEFDRRANHGSAFAATHFARQGLHVPPEHVHVSTGGTNRNRSPTGKPAFVFADDSAVDSYHTPAATNAAQSIGTVTDADLGDTTLSTRPCRTGQAAPKAAWSSCSSCSTRKGCVHTFTPTIAGRPTAETSGEFSARSTDRMFDIHSGPPRRRGRAVCGGNGHWAT